MKPITSILKPGFQQKVSRSAAAFDYWQSISGGILALIIVSQIFFEAGIIFGRDFILIRAKLLSGFYVFGRNTPYILVALGLVLLIVYGFHVLLSIRKIPKQFQQLRNFYQLLRQLKHQDSFIWFIQMITGLMLLFLFSNHIIMLLTSPTTVELTNIIDQSIEPRLFLFYLVVLISVIVHSGTGLYRIALKWGFTFNQTRKRLKQFLWLYVVFLFILGLSSLVIYTTNV